MTNDEKAKAYDEALKDMRAIYPNLKGDIKLAVEHAFPQLKESEDEKVRKHIIDIIKDNAKSKCIPCDAEIAYLEKQKDVSKAIEAVDRIDKYIDEHLANAHDMKDSNPDKKYYHGWDDALGAMAGILQDVYSGEKQKEQKSNVLQNAFDKSKKDYTLEEKSKASDYAESILPTSIMYGESEEEYKIHTIIEAAFIAGQKEQKSTEWSDDCREEGIQTTFAFYTYKDDPSTLYLSNVFVEETSRNKGFGTKILTAAEKVAETLGITSIRLKVKRDNPANVWYRKHGYGLMTFEGDYDWLEKDLEYLNPIHWKPSKEQMSSLNYFIKLWGNSDDQLEYTQIFNNVKSLRDDLEELM